MNKIEQSPESYDSMYREGGYQGAFDLPYARSSYYPLFKAVLGELERRSVPDVLEVGCGAGGFSHMLLDRTRISYKGFDFSPVAIQKAGERTGQPSLYYEGDATRPETYPNDYSAIVCTEVLEHIEGDLSAVANWRNGVLCVCSVPNYDSDSHVRFFRTEADVLTRYGDLIDIESIRRIKKPVITERTLASYIRALKWNRYRPQRLLSIVGLGNFENVGGWFVFVGKRR